LPLVSIEAGQVWNIVDELIVASARHFAERFAPTLTRFAAGSDHKRVVSDLDVHFSIESRLLEELLGDADTFGVTDLDDAGFHAVRLA
jgi:hypothetical protein